MSHTIQYSPEFQRDLDDIWDYIVLEFANPDAADRIADGILDAVRILADFPYSGRKVLLPGGMDSGYRFVVFEAYVIVYRIHGNHVQVARVVHSALDYMRSLFPWLRKSKDRDDV